MKTLTALVFFATSLTSLSAQTGSEQDRFREAEGRFNAQNYGASLSLYDSFLESFPLSRYAPDAQFRRGICLYRLKRLSESVRAFELVEKRYQSTRFLPYLPFWKGLVLFDLGRFAEAAKSLDAYIQNRMEAGSTDLIAEAISYAGRAFYTLDRREDAIRVLSKLTEIPGRGEPAQSALLLLASLYLAADFPDKALAVLESVNADDPTSRNTITTDLYMGESLFKLKRYFEAEVMYREVIDRSALFPDPAAVSLSFKRLFGLLETSGRNDELESLMFQAEKLLSSDPSVLMEFWLSAGVNYYNQSRYDLASSYFRRVLALGGREKAPLPAYLYLAYTYEKDGQPVQAVRVLEEGLGDGTDAYTGMRGELILKLGEARLNLNQFDEAAEAYTRYLASNPGEGEKAAGAAYSLGFCLLSQKRYAEAEKALKGAIEANPQTDLLARIHKLLTVIYRQTGNSVALKTSLETYLSLAPSDAEARIDYISMVFLEGNYFLVREQLEALYRREPSLILHQKSDGPLPAAVKLAYLYGLSLVGLKQYEAALSTLSNIQAPAAYVRPEATAYVTSIYEDLLYYRGWTLYRLSRFEEAERTFAGLLKSFPGYGKASAVGYYAGWCAYSLGNYTVAGDYFQASADTAASPKQISDSMFMLGKTFAAVKEYTKAAVRYRTLALRYPDSDLAYEALFEEAGIVAELGKADESAALYLTLFETLTKAALIPFREESLFRRAEVLFHAEKYEKARNAYYDYRLYFHGGKFMDAALYWGGVSAMNLKEDYAALLLWERLTAERRDSPFRAEALRRSGDLYKARKEYEKAADAYREVVGLYPETASAYKLNVEIRALELILAGSTEEEAGLRAAVTASGGGTSAQALNAMINLAKYLLGKGETGQDEARRLIDRVLDAVKSGTLPAGGNNAAAQNAIAEISASALYLSGEYFFRRGNLKKASDDFFEAASVNPDNADFSASSLYRAAEILLDAGYRGDATNIVDLITELYPATVWENEGKRILGVKP